MILKQVFYGMFHSPQKFEFGAGSEVTPELTAFQLREAIVSYICC